VGVPLACVDVVPHPVPRTSPTGGHDGLRVLGRLAVEVVHEAMAAATLALPSPGIVLTFAVVHRGEATPEVGRLRPGAVYGD
jgi:hypothetical protein